MVTRRLETKDELFLKVLGQKIRKIIIEDLGYSSLDRFASENLKHITKPTLYQICDGKRDMKISTLLGLSRSLNITLQDLL